MDQRQHQATVIDFSQLAIASYFELMKNEGEFDHFLFKHVILNSIIHNFSSHPSKLKILACDGNRNWRYDEFDFYKQVRRDQKKTDEHDWKMIYSIMGEIREEIRERTSIKVLHSPFLEGDDCIFACAKAFRDVCLISSDKDFFQLHRQGFIQISPRTKERLKCDDPMEFLSVKILKGDHGDGIPNIFSPDNQFIEKASRQTPITKNVIEEWNRYYDYFNGVDERLFDDFEKGKVFKRVKEKGLDVNELRSNIERNQKLIDLRNVPEEFLEDVFDQISKEEKPDPIGFLSYLSENGLVTIGMEINSFN